MLQILETNKNGVSVHSKSFFIFSEFLSFIVYNSSFLHNTGALFLVNQDQ